MVKSLEEYVYRSVIARIQRRIGGAAVLLSKTITAW